MITQRAQAPWQGGLKDGVGSFRFGSVTGRYSYSSRFEGGSGSTPEEPIGAAHAGRFSVALALVLGEHGHTPVAIDTTATLPLDPDRLVIGPIELETEAEVPFVSDSVFQSCAERAKENCPVSKTLSGVEILAKSSKLKQVPVEHA